MDWDLNPPPLSEMKDRDVRERGNHLKGKRIALLLTGSIATYRAPDLVRELRREGGEVVVFITKEGLRYVSKEALEWTSLNRVIDEFTADAEHLSDSAPFDAYLVAPATYNVINKVARGIADCVVSSTLASALGKLEQKQTTVLIAPAMHGNLHNSILSDSLKKLRSMAVSLIPPRQENGKNNLPSKEILVAETIRGIKPSPLKGLDILVTGGSTPVYLDSIRRIVTRFTGALSIEIAKEAYFQGATVHLVIDAHSHSPPDYLKSHLVENYDDYGETVKQLLQTKPISAGIFSAAVADFRPETVFPGKMPSGQPQMLKLVTTEKITQQVSEQFPTLLMVTFKYEEKLSHEKLMTIAEFYLKKGSSIVVANRGEEKGAAGEQVAWLVEQDLPAQKMEGKPQIAHILLKRLAEKLSGSPIADDQPVSFFL